YCDAIDRLEGMLGHPSSEAKKVFASEVCSPEISGDEDGVRALDIRDKLVSEVERFRRVEMKKKGKHLRSCPDKRIAVNTYERKFGELKEMIPKPHETYLSGLF
ncbi:5064_t:CDS:2, partial [Paraglomus occultum]